MLNRKILSFFGLRPTGDFGPWTFYTDKRGTPVWFLKAPPEKPASPRQTWIRYKFGIFAQMWIMLPEQTKINWEKATKKTSLKMTGYNLWQWWKWRENEAVIRTIERQSGIALLP